MIRCIAAFMLLASIAQAQSIARIGLSYNGPFGDSPGYLTGPNWPPITNGTVIDYGEYPLLRMWLMDNNGMGSIFPLDHTGLPDTIILKVGEVRDGVREARIHRFKNGVRMSSNLVYLPYVQNPDFP